MTSISSACHAPTPRGSLRSPTGRGRPYPPALVASVRTLVETTALRDGEIAARAGLHEATVGRWARRFGWRRLGEGDADRSTSGVMPRSHEVASRSTRERGARFETAPAAPPRHDAESGPRRYVRYGPAEHEAARALVEGSQLSLEQIALRLGIGSATIARWKRRFRWSQPPRPGEPPPHFYRSRRRRGRPYGADAVGTARQLVTTTLLPQKRIAAQAGVSQATVSKWIRRWGWTRPDVAPASHRFSAARRTGPLAETGDRRGRPYAADIRREARALWELTRLPTSIIGARLGAQPVTVARWAREEAWERPRGRAGARQLRGFFGALRPGR